MKASSSTRLQKPKTQCSGSAEGVKKAVEAEEVLGADKAGVKMSDRTCLFELKY